MKKFTLTTALLFAGTVPAAYSDAIEIDGEINLQGRYFSQSPNLMGQDDQSTQWAIAARAEFRWQNEEGNQRATFIPYSRWDAIDSDRSLIDAQEAYWAYQGEELEWLVGVNTVFWGVTESVHLVDIINQTDAVADIDGEQKLGQPMINLAWQQEWGLLNAYVMPWFRERTFAGRDGRLRTPLPVDGDDAAYESSAEQNHADIALRYSHYFGDFDVALSLFDGTSREAVLQFNGNELRPFYQQITQLGVEVQYTRDAWLWKLESIWRDSESDRFWAAVAGFEVTQYQVFETNADLGYLLEYQYDDRAETEPLSLADNDIFIGARVALNDVQDTAILAGFIFDHHTNESIINIEAERRLGSDYVLEMNLRFFDSRKDTDSLNSIENDDYFEVSISSFF